MAPEASRAALPLCSYVPAQSEQGLEHAFDEHYSQAEREGPVTTYIVSLPPN